MKKSQEAYKKALKALDEAVKSTRTAHQSEIDKLAEARRAVDQLQAARDPLSAAKRTIAEDLLSKVKAEFPNTVNRIYSQFDATVAQVRRELASELEENGVIRAADMDPTAAALINSGVLRPVDMAQMVADFSENATILTLLRREAQRQLDGLSMDGPDAAAARREYLEIIEAARSDGGEYLETFDDLAKGARTLSGRGTDGTFISLDRLGCCTSLFAWENLVAPIMTAAELEADS